VFHPGKAKIANFRADYARHSDVCEVFERDMKALYLLAFLLTANHAQSEHCFLLTLEDAFKKHSVFKDWAESCVRRSLIKNAIEIVCPPAVRDDRKRDLWSAWKRWISRATLKRRNPDLESLISFHNTMRG
jgi:hypothetical protein